MGNKTITYGAIYSYLSDQKKKHRLWFDNSMNKVLELAYTKMLFEKGMPPLEDTVDPHHIWGYYREAQSTLEEGIRSGDFLEGLSGSGLAVKILISAAENPRPTRMMPMRLSDYLQKIANKYSN